MLSGKAMDSALAEEGKAAPSPSLGLYVQRRHRPPMESPYDGPFQKTTAAAVNERTGGFGSHAAARLKRMRQGVEAEAPMIDTGLAGKPLPADSPTWSFSLPDEASTDGDPAVPVWREVLSDQQSAARPSAEQRRGHAMSTGGPVAAAPSPLEPVAEEQVASRPAWPPVLHSNEKFVWGNWQLGPENRVATTAANEVVDHPGTRLNPLIVVGPAGSGKSHLLWALGGTLWNQSPEMEVRMISGGSFPGSLVEEWDVALQGCKGLLIDDLQLISVDAQASHALGIMVDLCLNLGVQVVISADSDVQTSGSLARSLASAVTVNLGLPEPDTLLLNLRNRALRRGLALSDEQLQAVATHAGADWRRAEAGFETVSLAIEAGAEPLGVSDIRSILAGEELPMRDSDGLLAWDSEQTGQRIVREVLDHVLPREAQPNIEIVSELESRVDDYQPPDLMPDDSADAVDALLARHLGREKSALEDARERINRADEETILEAPRPDVPKIDMMSDSFLDRLENRLRDHQDELLGLEAEMEIIAYGIDDAEPSDLAEMADRMLEIERRLSRISRVDAGDQMMPRKKPKRPYEPEPLNEFTPEGEWDIDEDSVGADDLLSKPTALLRPIPILIPIYTEEE
jgi:hypothetical protein